MMKALRVVALTTALTAGLSACGEETKTVTRGELVLALQTDMALPKDVDNVRIHISTYGSTVFKSDYQVGPSGLKIPATLGILANPDRPSAPVTIQVIGFQNAKPRVLRETITTIPIERIASLRVPIEWLCDDSARLAGGEVESACPTEQTCVAGTCMTSALNSEDLPDFQPEEIFGGGKGPGDGACFDVAQCFASAMNLSVDSATCRATLPTDESNLNIALRLPGMGDGICSGGVCFVPLDGGEGGQWSRAGAAGSDQGGISIQLPQGVCDKLQSGKVQAVVASKQCMTKTTKVPPCGPWSSTGGGGTITADGGGGTIGMPDATTGDDTGTRVDATLPPTDDGGTSIDAGPMPDMSGTTDITTGSDMGPIADGPANMDRGPGPSDVCMGDNCGQPPNCQPPPPPTDGGVCMGVVSSPPPNGTSVCHWDVPGGIATTGMGFCGNLLNVELMNLPGMPGPRRIQQVPEGQCADILSWQFIPSMNVLELCPVACSHVKADGTTVQFVYGCPSMTGPPPDGGGPPPDGIGPPLPDGFMPPPDGPPPPPDASIDGDAGAAPMVPIFGGTFEMGCMSQDLACNSDEFPARMVQVSDFSIDETEVTMGAYDQCIKAGMCVAPPCSSWQPTAKANWPVACVNWQEAANYCAWVGKRLPTEAEWEIAARGNDGFIYPWGDQTPDCMRANFSLCSFNSTQAARMFMMGVSPYGAHDMAGNVAEWVFDWYGPYEGQMPMPNPTGPPMGTQRIVRGGDYSSGSAGVRISHRGPIDPTMRVDNVGFRCAKPGF